jgi:ABC-2 type transport system permease protein
MHSNKLEPQPYLVQLFDLTWLQLSNWRWSWRLLTFTGTVLPLFSMFSFAYFARGGETTDVTYIYTGNIVFSLLFAYQGMVAGNFAYMKANGMLNFFASLPIRRSSLILGTLFSFFLLLLPSLVTVILVGAWLLAIPLHVHILIMVVAPLAALPLAALGALIGASSERPENAMSLNRLVTLPMLVIGPVFVPIDQLPSAVVAVSWFSPATYVSSALRQVLISSITPRLGLDLLALSLFTLLGLILARWLMDWRIR